MDNVKKPGKVFEKSKPSMNCNLPPALQRRDTNHNWKLWFYDVKAAAPDFTTRYSDGLSDLCEVETRRDLILALQRHSIYHGDLSQKIPPGCSYCFFRFEIKPMWEDDGNYNGGRFVLWIHSRTSDQARYFKQVSFLWWILIRNFMTEFFGDLKDHLCGSKVLFHSSQKTKISLWTTDTVTKDPKMQIEIVKKLNLLFRLHERLATEIFIDPLYQPHQKRTGYIGYVDP